MQHESATEFSNVACGVLRGRTFAQGVLHKRTFDGQLVHHRRRNQGDLLLDQRKIFLLSGREGTGKSALASNLRLLCELFIVSTRQLIAQVAVGSDRSSLIRAGDLLDREKGADWIIEAIDHALSQNPSSNGVCVDRIRKLAQAAAIKRRYPCRVTHVHLRANDDVLVNRLIRRSRANEDVPWQSLLALDKHLDAALLENADIVVETGYIDERAVFDLVKSKMPECYPRDTS